METRHNRQTISLHPINMLASLIDSVCATGFIAVPQTRVDAGSKCKKQSLI
jgi:hypothetical protein